MDERVIINSIKIGTIRYKKMKVVKKLIFSLNSFIIFSGSREQYLPTSYLRHEV